MSACGRWRLRSDLVLPSRIIVESTQLSTKSHNIPEIREANGSEGRLKERATFTDLTDAYVPVTTDVGRDTQPINVIHTNRISFWTERS